MSPDPSAVASVAVMCTAWPFLLADNGMAVVIEATFMAAAAMAAMESCCALPISAE